MIHINEYMRVIKLYNSGLNWLKDETPSDCFVVLSSPENDNGFLMNIIGITNEAFEIIKNDMPYYMEVENDIQ